MKREHQIYAILVDTAMESAREWLDRMFPPSCTVIFDVHPVWKRGSLTVHQPISGGANAMRVSEPREDGVWVEYASQTIDYRFKWVTP